MKKNILITGSTDGIGKATAVKLAKAGHHIWLHGRNADKLAASIQSVKSDSGNPRVYGHLADFTRLDAVIRMGRQLNETLPHLDVLIHNAGIYHALTSPLMIDSRFIVNFLSPYCLTKYILPALQRSVAPRLLSISSAAQSSVNPAVFKRNLMLPDSSAYAQSKLALTMWSMAFAAQYPDICTIAVNPGSLLNTKMVRSAFGGGQASLDKGADILFALATDPIYQQHSGTYFDNDLGRFANPHPDAGDKQKQRDLLQSADYILSTIEETA